MKDSLFIILFLLTSVQVHAQISVISPVTNSQVPAPVWVRAHSEGCNGNIPTAFGYSVDSSSTMKWGVTDYDIDVTDSSILPGTHIIYFKSWTSAGVCPVVSSTVTITQVVSGINAVSPINNSAMPYPVVIKGNVSDCSGLPTTAFGYSVDDSSAITLGTPIAINNSDESIAPGHHVIYFKAWSGSTICPLISRSVTVTPAIPSNATTTSNIELLSSWIWNHDAGTSGSSSGTSSLVSSPSISGQSREYSMEYSSDGGEIFYTKFGSDTVSTHFVYENHVWIDNPSDVANLEMDLNQVMANGQTVIYGIQCDGSSGTWDYTINAGTPTVPVDKWEHSNVDCNPRNWSANSWHHVMIGYHRDGSGNVTYDYVTLDGTTSYFVNAVGNSAFALNWASVLLTNFQIDGYGVTGSAIVYSTGMNVYRW